MTEFSHGLRTHMKSNPGSSLHTQLKHQNPGQATAGLRLWGFGIHPVSTECLSWSTRPCSPFMWGKAWEIFRSIGPSTSRSKRGFTPLPSETRPASRPRSGDGGVLSRSHNPREINPGSSFHATETPKARAGTRQPEIMGFRYSPGVYRVPFLVNEALFPFHVVDGLGYL